MSIVAAGVFSAVSGFSAEARSSSPAYVQQATGFGSSTLDTASIMKPALDMLGMMSASNARPSAGNLADTLQIGQLNAVSIDQAGLGNVGIVQQVGYANTASISQAGSGHQAFISQRGSNNVAIIRQR
jgi:hypothetical protein